jgi:hypothetical protein
MVKMLRPQGKSRAKRQSDLYYPVQAGAELLVRRGAHSVQTGSGQAVELSGSEITVDSGYPLASGMEIELILPWPGFPGTVDGLLLHIKGRTVRTQGNRATVHIAEYKLEMRPEPKAALVSEQRAAGGKSAKSGDRASLPHVAPLAS